MKILLVEDALLAGKVASFILSDLHCDVDVASSGTQALEKASNQKYNLILMDLDLPDTSGFEVTQRMREASITTPIYALSAHSDRDTREQAIASGMTGFLTKPLGEGQIRELLLKSAVDQNG